MKIITAAILLVIVMSGCENYKGIRPITQRDSSDFHVIVIDGCQYLQNSYSAASPLTHKGNCKNHINNINNQVATDTIYMPVNGKYENIIIKHTGKLINIQQ